MLIAFRLCGGTIHQRCYNAGKEFRIAEVLTISEIESQFSGEWILVVDPQVDENLEVLSGQVVCHSKDRDEVYRAAVAHQGGDLAILFNGEQPPNTAIMI